MVVLEFDAVGIVAEIALERFRHAPRQLRAVEEDAHLGVQPARARIEIVGADEADPAVERERLGAGASSGASLHAKTFAVDGQRIFVGSFNFDPRSAHLNTELGLLIDSPALAGQLSAVFDKDVPEGAYEVRLTDDGLEWVEQTPGGEKRHDTEPETGIMRRALVKFLSWLPIDWML